MKNHKLLLFILTGHLLASGLAAQTADGLVSAGRACLVAHNLTGAYSNFNAAVTLSPTNEAANALAAVTRLLLLPQQPAGSNFLNRLGFSVSGRDIYNWTAALPKDPNGSTVLPANFNSSEAISFYRTNIMVALAASRTNLARITNQAFTLSLTVNETSIESVTVDYGDILLLQALERVTEFMGYTLNAHNFSVVINHLKDLGNADPSQLSIQRVLADYPSLLTQASAADLASSKAALTNAIALYQQASDFIRNTRPAGAVRLFNLETNDLVAEAQFRDELAKTPQSLNGPVKFNTNDTFSLYAGAYFAGTKSLRSLVPQFNGNRYVNNSLPDYTFGGFLVDEPACDTESLLREKLGRSYAGIYIGDLYDSYYYLGSYAVIVRTNQLATVVGYDESQANGIFFDFKVGDDGYWEFETNGVYGSGNFYKDGFQDGEVDSPMGTDWLYGERQPALGSFQNAAGYYTGTWTGGGVSGQLRAVLSADGQVYFCEIDSTGELGDGGWGEIDSTNHFTGASVHGTEVVGTLNRTAFTMTGTLTNSDQNQITSGTWSMSRSANVPFDVPPVITTPPQSKIVPLGTNVTFSLVATGSPPLCYQWFSNDVAIAKATNTSLVLSHVQRSSAATYSVSVRNVVGEADATASLLVSSLSTAMMPVATNANVLEFSFGLASDGTNYLVGFSSGANVCAQLLSPNGTRIGSALILGGGAGIIPPQAQVVSGSTNYLVIWSDTTISSGVDMFGQFVSRSGAKIGSKFPLLQSLGSHGFQAIESLASDGTNYLVVWMDEANLTGTGTSASYGQLVTAAGALSGPEFVLAEVGAPNPAEGVTVAFGKTNYLATWQSGFLTGYPDDYDGHYTTYGAFISPGGAVGDPFPISQTDSPDNNFSPGMAFDGTNYLVVWNRNIGTPSSGWINEWAQYGRLVSADGTFPGDEVLVSAVWSMMPSLAFDGSNYLMAWNFNTTKADQNIHFRFFDRSASPLGTEFVLFSAQGANAPLSAWNGVIFDGKQFAIAATLGVFTTNSGLISADVYTAFLPASGGATTPTILVQPLSQTNATGTVARFTVTAAGLPPLGYQWQKNGTNLANGARISGATAGSLTVSNLATTDAGNYSVNVGNSFGSVTSSNAVLTVFIPDTAKPTVTISSPTANQHWSNEVFTVTGKAGDNVSVANVFYSLNGSGWAPAVTANNWSNWTAQVTLVPGTNTVQAYAVDTVGNFSTTNKTSLVYILSAPLTVSTNGNGTISPNYNGALLQIGQNYSMTATASAGFGFTGWTGSSTTNGATLKFVMASDLTFTANFVDTARPTNGISSPTANQHWSNAVFTVSGKARDNVAVANVFYSLNGSGWAAASTANAWSNWTAQVTLVPGTNTIQAYAVDTVGNFSTTNKASLVFILSAPLTVSTNGNGTISPNYNGALLQIGANYSMTATASTGFGFTGWTGSSTTNGATLKFIMASNLTFTANFADTAKPTNGISSPTANQHWSNAVFTVTGKAGDNVSVANVFYSLNGSGWAPAVTANNWSNWTAQVTLVPGTNTVQAYAVDTVGNFSTTNKTSLVYILSAPLTVSTNGNGTISPNYNGALLQIGANYSMTATASTGFGFTGWTGSSTTNGATLKFIMASNLTFTANFVDTARPTNGISSPTANQHWSNAVFTVSGKARDNVAVANVFYSLNGSAWTAASTANNWTNWTAGVGLVPGTNVVKAYAADTIGNLSVTSSVSFIYVLSAVLTVNTNGNGTISPNYNGALLQIGANYSMTATASAGFGFTGWTGSSTTNGATLKFLMASNLTFTANFVDVARPTNTITAPTSGQRWSNSVFTVTGTARDNAAVSTVWYQLNGVAWSNALTANGWTNWTGDLTLNPGTNVVQAYAVDTSGNVSTTNSVSFQFVVTNQLQIRASGLGTISPNYSNAWLEIGRNYSITSTPASGFVFTNWVTSTNWIGGTTTTKTNLPFMMASNLTLQVNFLDVTKPTLAITAPTSGQRMTNALTTVVGTASDNWKVSAVWYQLTNGILTGGTWSLATTTNNYTNWTTTVTLAAGTNTVKAYAVDLGGNYSTTSSVSVLSSNTFKLQLNFAMNQPLTSTGLNLTLQISSNLNGHIQVSTNLLNWTTLTNFVGTNTTLNFRDPAATNFKSRFYRAVIP